jgi:hypothetical protein
MGLRVISTEAREPAVAVRIISIVTSTRGATPGGGGGCCGCGAAAAALKRSFSTSSTACTASSWALLTMACRSAPEYPAVQFATSSNFTPESRAQGRAAATQHASGQAEPCGSVPPSQNHGSRRTCRHVKLAGHPDTAAHSIRSAAESGSTVSKQAAPAGAGMHYERQASTRQLLPGAAAAAAAAAASLTYFCNISRRSSRSGKSQCAIVSSRPGRRMAGSIVSGRDVAPIT